MKLLKMIPVIGLLLSSTSAAGEEAGQFPVEYGERFVYTATTSDPAFKLINTYGSLNGSSIDSGVPVVGGDFVMTPDNTIPGSTTLTATINPSLSLASSSCNLPGHVPMFSVELEVAGEVKDTRVITLGQLRKTQSDRFSAPSSGVCSVRINRLLDECLRYWSSTCSYNGLNETTGNLVLATNVYSDSLSKLSIKLLNPISRAKVSKMELKFTVD